MKSISYCLFTLGLLSLCYSIFLLIERYNPSRISFNNYEEQRHSVAVAHLVPVRLKIESAKINLAIEPATYTKEEWTVTKRGISYLVSSPVPGSPGNSILYGHNWPTLLGNLTKTQPGDIIEITYNDGKKKHFKITGTAIVTPDETHILQNTKDTRITIYTCTGFLDMKRFVVTAEYEIDKTTASLHTL
jgi:LPXTG-site transpeptidase (sortase) family protein